MTDPKTIREQNIENEGFRKGLEERVGVFQKMVWTVIGLLGAIMIGAGAIYIQIGDLKTDVGVIRTNIINLVERFSKMEKSAEDSRASERQIITTLGRIEAQVPKSDPIIAGFYLTASEASAIAQVLRPPLRNDNQPTISVGSRVPENMLRPIPDELLAKIPRLRGARYVIDANNAVALAAPGTDVIFAIV
jgi:hypothetical protein